jgi:hypothetical protein
MVALLDVNAALPESEQDFWKNILYRCVDCPAEVSDDDDPFSQPDQVDAYLREDGWTRFCCEMEQNLCGGVSEDEYAESFRKAVHRLTKDVTQDFRVSLSLYYLEHDPDLYMSFDRQELAA